MEEPGLWSPADRYTGKRLLAASLGPVLTATILIIPAITKLSNAHTVLVAWSILFMIANIASVRYLNNL